MLVEAAIVNSHIDPKIFVEVRLDGVFEQHKFTSTDQNFFQRKFRASAARLKARSV